MTWFKNLFRKEVVEAKPEYSIDLSDTENDDEVDLDLNFSIFFSNGSLSYFIDCEDGKEEQLGVLIGMLTTGKLNAHIANVCISLMGKDKAMQIFEANQAYMKQLKQSDEERPVILPSKAFQNDSEITEMSDI